MSCDPSFRSSNQGRSSQRCCRLSGRPISGEERRRRRRRRKRWEGRAVRGRGVRWSSRSVTQRGFPGRLSPGLLLFSHCRTAERRPLCAYHFFSIIDSLSLSLQRRWQFPRSLVSKNELECKGKSIFIRVFICARWGLYLLVLRKA